MNTSFFSHTVFAIVCLLLFLSPLSCGRRGDPAIPKYEKPITEKDTSREKEDVSPERTVPEAEVEKTAVPGPPSNVNAVYNGRIIVLVWDEVKESGVEYYRVYRSMGEEYEIIAETATPAFIDREVKKGGRYYYRVSAVGASEGPLSEKTGITAEVR